MAKAAPRPRTMRLRRVKTYQTASGGDYGRWDVSLPPALIEAQGWKQGDELEAVEHKDGILLRRAK